MTKYVMEKWNMSATWNLLLFMKFVEDYIENHYIFYSFEGMTIKVKTKFFI